VSGHAIARRFRGGSAHIVIFRFFENTTGGAGSFFVFAGKMPLWGSFAVVLGAVSVFVCCFADNFSVVSLSFLSNYSIIYHITVYTPSADMER
jgi:hypothetical protein